MIVCIFCENEIEGDVFGNNATCDNCNAEFDTDWDYMDYGTIVRWIVKVKKLPDKDKCKHYSFTEIRYTITCDGCGIELCFCDDMGDEEGHNIEIHKFDHDW